MELHKHTPEECKAVLKSIQDLVKQIDRNPHKEVRQALCEAVVDICDMLLRDGKEV